MQSRFYPSLMIFSLVWGIFTCAVPEVRAGERIIFIPSSRPMQSIMAVKSWSRSRSLEQALAESDASGSSRAASSGEQMMSISLPATFSISQKEALRLKKLKDREDNWIFATQDDYDEDNAFSEAGRASESSQAGEYTENSGSSTDSRRSSNNSRDRRDSALPFGEEQSKSLVEKFLAGEGDDSAFPETGESRENREELYGDTQDPGSDGRDDPLADFERQIAAYDRYLSGGGTGSDDDSDSDSDSSDQSRRGDDRDTDSQWDRLFSGRNAVLSNGLNSRVNEDESEAPVTSGSLVESGYSTGVGYLSRSRSLHSESRVAQILGSGSGTDRGSEDTVSAKDSGPSRLFSGNDPIDTAADQSSRIPGSSTFSSNNLNQAGVPNGGFGGAQDTISSLFNNNSGGVIGTASRPSFDASQEQKEEFFRRPTVLSFPKRGF